MLKTFFLTAMLFLFSALDGFTAEKNTVSAGIDPADKIQELINARVFLNQDGMDTMRTESVVLNKDQKEFLYDQNKKNGAWGWLDLVLPSLGNWFVGDKNGAIIDIVGNAVGGVAIVGGYAFFIYTTVSDRSTTLSGINPVGVIIMLGGIGLMIISDFGGVSSAYQYTEEYNNKLRGGLGLPVIKGDLSGNGMGQISPRSYAASSDVIHLDLVSIRF